MKGKLFLSKQLSSLEKGIVEEIMGAPDRRVTFYRFMQLALYADKEGYYTRERQKIGKAEDYYTSSTVNPVFAKTILNSFIDMYQNFTNYDEYMLLEIGGGNGQFAYDLLEELKRENHTIYRNFKYYLLEASSFNEKLQKEKLVGHLDRVLFVRSLAELPKDFRGIIYGNELIDAFPVHRVTKQKGALREIYVSWDKKKQSFVEEIGSLSDARLVDYFNDVAIDLREGQRAEVNLDVIDWLEELAKVLKEGYLVLIDYGHLADTLYDSNRHAGSLLCYHKHQASDNPYQLVGEQDITTHVNFSTIINEAKKQGFNKLYYNFQSNFLLSNQILKYFKEHATVDDKGQDGVKESDIKTNRAIRQLIAPGEMGETFKVIVFHKNMKSKEYLFQKNFWD